MKKTFTTSVILSLVVVITKICGFGRELLMTYFYGLSDVTDAFNISLVIPNFFNLVFVQATSVAFIPLVHSITKIKGEKESNIFVSNLILLIGTCSTLFALIVFLLAPQLVKLFASGFNDSTSLLATRMLRICCWFLIMQAPVSVLAAFCQSKKKFITVSLFGLILDASYVCMILFAFYTKRSVLLGLIPVVSIIIQLCIIIPVAFKNGYRIHIFFKKNYWKYLGTFFLIALPSLLNVGLNQFNIVIGKSIASQMAEGSISSYNYAWTICNLYESMVISSLCTVIFTEMSDYISGGNKVKALSTFKKAFNLILIVIIPLSLFTSFFSKEITQTIFERGAFDKEDTLQTSECLKFLAFSSSFYVAGNLCLRILYADKKILAVGVVSIISFGISILTNFLLFKYTNIGVAGIAIAGALLNILNCILFLIFICFKYKYNIFGDSKKMLIYIPFILIILILIKLLNKYLMTNVNVYQAIFRLGILFVGYVVLMVGVLYHKEIKSQMKLIKK